MAVLLREWFKYRVEKDLLHNNYNDDGGLF